MAELALLFIFLRERGRGHVRVKTIVVKTKLLGDHHGRHKKRMVIRHGKNEGTGNV